MTPATIVTIIILTTWLKLMALAGLAVGVLCVLLLAARDAYYRFDALRDQNSVLLEHFAKDGGGSGLIAWACRTFALWAPFGRKIIPGRGDFDPYLLRVYLTPRIGPFHPFLHMFFRGDDDVEYHNHPWHRAWSLILTRGYIEHKADPLALHVVRSSGKLGMRVWSVRRAPGDLLQLTRSTWHRVELHRGRCWTLFLAGARVDAPEEIAWGFLNAASGWYAPWRKHVAEKRGL